MSRKGGKWLFNKKRVMTKPLKPWVDIPGLLPVVKKLFYPGNPKYWRIPQIGKPVFIKVPPNPIAYTNKKYGRPLGPRLPYHFEPQLSKPKISNLSNFGKWMRLNHWKKTGIKKRFKQKPWTTTQSNRVKPIYGFGNYHC